MRRAYGVGQEPARVADVHDVDELAERRTLLGFVQQQLKSLMPEAARCLERPRRDRVHTDPFGPSS
jgi:hypothetical protein